MDEDRAREVLELGPQYSLSDVENSYITKVLGCHPDQGGDPEQFQEILDAREVAMNALSGGDLTPYQPLDRPESTNNDNVREQTEKTISRVVRRQTSQYRRFRRSVKIFTALTGLPAFLQLLLTILYSVTGQRNFVLLSPMSREILFLLGPFAILGGFYLWYLRFRIQTIEEMITEMDEMFALNSNILSLLQELPISFDNRSVSDNQLRNAIDRWATDSGEQETRHTSIFSKLSQTLYVLSTSLDTRSIARQIGSEDFNRLFIQKCLENEILVEQLHLDDPDQMGVRYSLANGD